MIEYKFKTYAADTPEEEILKDVRIVAKAAGDIWGVPAIQFDPREFDTEKEAWDYLTGLQDGGQAFAVKTFDYSGVQLSKKAERMEQRLEEAQDKKAAYAEAHSVKTKAGFITCPGCKSRLSREHLKGEACPVCGKDLRSAATLTRLEKMDTQLDELANKVSFEQKKKVKKATPVWLVMFAVIG